MDLNSLKPHFVALIEKLIEDQPGLRIRSVIVHLKSAPAPQNYLFSMGKMSSGGSFTPAYPSNIFVGASNYLREELSEALQAIHAEYRNDHPLRKTLYFRFNKSRDALDIFSASSMVSTSAVKL